MEIANLHLTVRVAKQADSGAISALLHNTPYSHVHVDWRLPYEWLDTGGFVVAETTRGHILGAGVIQACFAVGADPPPGAWVRVAAVRERESVVPVLRAMYSKVSNYLKENGITEVGWLPRTGWPAEWMEALEFEHIDHVVTYVKPNLELPSHFAHNEAISVRKVRVDDLPRLEQIEAAAFEPLWRHSADGLAMGWRHATSFDVAEIDGWVVGFQYSSASDIQNAGHLVRLTVSPDVHRSGIGSDLLVATLNNFREQRLQEATLNTQLSNEPSRKLYEKFGFERAGQRWPVWRRFV